jgi:hypothetical protein
LAQQLDSHHDNSPAHKALTVKQFLAHKSITEVEYTYRFPDLALNDFWLFPKIKRFQDTEGTRRNVIMALKVITQQEFYKCFQQ